MHQVLNKEGGGGKQQEKKRIKGLIFFCSPQVNPCNYYRSHYYKQNNSDLYCEEKKAQ